MGCRGGAAFAHLRKVCGKHGNCSPSEGGIGTMYRQTGLQYALVAVALQPTFGRCAENAENCSPSEGGIGTMYRQTGLQYALGAVAFLSTFGRCAENTGNCSPSEGGMRRNKKPAERTRLHRFGPHSLSAVGLLGRSVVSDSVCSRGCGASSHLRKVCGKRGKLLTFGRWNRSKVEIRNRQSARDSTGSVLTV